LASLSGNSPRAIALIDVPDLQSQLKRVGGALEHDVTAVMRQLETGFAELDTARSDVHPFDAVYLYSPLDADRTGGIERAVLRERGIGVKRECQACGKTCTHCQAGATSDPGGRGRESLLADDLIELAREDAYDWAAVVSTDLLLIPVVRFVQAHGRKIVHGCFPPVALDLTQECWASIDLSRPRHIPDPGETG
jgi:hypothetical protein